MRNPRPTTRPAILEMRAISSPSDMEADTALFLSPSMLYMTETAIWDAACDFAETVREVTEWWEGQGYLRLEMTIWPGQEAHCLVTYGGTEEETKAWGATEVAVANLYIS